MFHASKQPTALNLVNVNQIVVSERLEYRDKGFKYFFGYKDNNIIRQLCIIIFTQMSGFIIYFNNGGKIISFVIEDDSVLVKYNEIWNNIKKSLNMKFHSMPVYDEKYIKAKVKKFNGVVNTNFWVIKYQKKVCNTLV